MDQVTQQNAAMVEQGTAATHSLKGQSAELGRLLGGFTLSGVRQGAGCSGSRRAARHSGGVPLQLQRALRAPPARPPWRWTRSWQEF